MTRYVSIERFKEIVASMPNKPKSIDFHQKDERIKKVVVTLEVGYMTYICKIPARDSYLNTLASKFDRGA